MAEQSARDRQTRAELLRDMTIGFAPPFNPSDTTLASGPFTTFLVSVNTSNNLIDTQEGSYKTTAKQRSDLATLLKKRATQIVGRLKSNSVWAGEYASAKQAADRLRGSRLYQPKPPTDANTPTQVQTRNRGEQAYAEMAAHFERLMNTATGAPGWSTGAPLEVTLATLTGLLNQIKALNTTLSTLDATLTTNREKRKILYYAPKGLQEKFQAIKDSIKGQYGQASAEYQAAKGIKW